MLGLVLSFDLDVADRGTGTTEIPEQQTSSLQFDASSRPRPPVEELRTSVLHGPSDGFMHLLIAYRG
ncbi:MAG: hypothetical protein ABIL01_20640 [Pseudomonadota bacterium]